MVQWRASTIVRMAAKKKTKKKTAPKGATKRKTPKAVKRKPAKKAATKSRKRPSVARAKVGKLRIAVQKSGAGYQARVTGPGSGTLTAGTGATPAQAIAATKDLLRGGTGRVTARSGLSVREALIRRACRTYT